MKISYGYGPFGEPMRISGAMAGQNPFRFSTKYTDDETGLVYYGYRYYSPAMGRWVNRDPMMEQGGANLYGFCKNNAIGNVDSNGRMSIATSGGNGIISGEATPPSSPRDAFNWGPEPTIPGQPDNFMPNITRYPAPSSDADWAKFQADVGKPCNEQPATITITRNDSTSFGMITMRAELHPSGGNYKDLMLVWETCYRESNGTVGAIPQSVNQLESGIPGLSFM